MGIIKILDIGVATEQGRRDHQEDRFIIRGPGELSNKNLKDYALFAVCDGHGAAEASDHAAANLPYHIDAELTKNQTAKKELGQVIQDALDAEDQDLKDAGHLHQGSTCALTLLDMKGCMIHAADLGDSHIMLGQIDTDAQGTKAFITRRLSTPHNPENPAEQRRIAEAGGKINHQTGVPRLGVLGLTRSLGDHEMKQPVVSTVHSKHVMKGQQPATGDLVSNQAHTKSFQLKGPRLLMLATDGIGETPEASAAAARAVDLWDKGRSAEQIAGDIAKKAAKEEDADNVTVVIVFLDIEEAEESA